MSEKQIKTPPVSSRVKIYYVANARMPTEKAHGIQIAKMCEALIEAGAEVELIAPRRANTSRTIQDFYGLRVSVPTVYIWTPDWYSRGRLGFWASSVCFMVGYALYLLKKKRPGAAGVIWTIDVDQFSFFFIPYLGMPYIAEIHDAKPSTFTFRALFRRAARIVVINDIISRELGDIFKIPSGRISVHPNGVDLYQFQVRSKGEARRKLQLPFDTRVALYVGRLYQWKRLDILARAAYLLDAITLYVVGGSKEEFSQAAGVSDLPPNLVCVGGKGFGEIPLWLAAADVLLVGGTKQNNYSYLHTSAMKIFEYMAAGSEHAIVASDTPANRQILSDREATFYEPDNAEDLASKIRYAFDSWPEAAQLKGRNARAKVEGLTWEKRARSILKTFSYS